MTFEVNVSPRVFMGLRGLAGSRSLNTQKGREEAVGGGERRTGTRRRKMRRRS